MRRFALAMLSLAIFTPSAAQALWAEPSCDPSVDPTTCNISAPLNVSSVTQTKAGGLTITGALTANGTTTINGTGSTFNSSAIFNNSFTYTSTAANLNFTPSSIEDADVSNTLTSSIFIGTGSTTNAVDLNTAEVAGEQWVNTTGDTMTGALIINTPFIGTPALSITQSNTQAGINISGNSGAPAILLNPTGGTADGINITLGTGTAGQNLDLYATGTASGNMISAASTTTTAAAYPITVSATGATRSINVSNAAVGGYGVYANATNAGGGIGVAGTGITYGVAGTTTTGYGIYGRATTSGYAGYFDSSTTAGTGVYITLSSGATTTASKALEVAGKNGYGAYITSNGNSSTALYAENTNAAGGIVKYGIQAHVTTPSGIGILAQSDYGVAGHFVSSAGGKGIQIDVVAGATAIDAGIGDVVNTAAYRGGQFYPNENTGNGVYQNIPPTVVDYIPTAGTPYDVLYDGSDIWVASADTAEVERFSQVDGRLIATYSVSLINPATLVLVEDEIYVFDLFSGNTFYIINRFDGSITSDTFASSVTIQSAVYDGTSLWLGGSSNIYQYNFSTLTARYTAASATFPTILYADGYLWATDSAHDLVVKLDPDTYSSSTITVDDGPYGAVYDGQYIWVANYNDSTLVRINVEDSSTESTTLSSMGTNPREVTFDGARVWVGFSNNDGIGAYEVAEEGLGESDPLLGSDIGDVAFDGTYIWGVAPSANSLFKIAVGTGFDSGVSPVTRGLLMYNTSGALRCLYISGTTVSASSTLTNCQ